MVEDCPARVVDIGCGTGAVYECLEDSPQAFMAIDFSEQMLMQHPSGVGVEKALLDFNEAETFVRMEAFAPEMIVSASALQWCTNLGETFGRIADLDTPFAVALFTANTFKTLHETAGIRSPIVSHEAIVEATECFSTCEIETAQYELTFETTLEMLRYIKRSGVSGGDARLSYTQVRDLMEAYPRDCLEFEVMFLARG